jgi:hypothetical protein
MMRSGFPVVCALAVLLAGCATAPMPAGLAATPGEPVGYRYYDNFHPNWVNNPSPEATNSAKRYTYLWSAMSQDDQ